MNFDGARVGSGRGIKAQFTCFTSTNTGNLASLRSVTHPASDRVDTQVSILELFLMFLLELKISGPL